MSQNVCVGRCNARPRRLAEEHARALAIWQREMATWATAGHDRGPEPVRPAERPVQWVAGTPIWCLSDSAAVRAALVDLDEQMALRLTAGDGHGSLNLQERVSSSPEPSRDRKSVV